MVDKKSLWRGRASAAGCAVLLAVLVLLAHPWAEIGVVDDWSYVYSAKVLAATGHVAYNGWATAMLTWMLYWGALFIRIFGFSFFVVRCSMLAVSMLTVFAVHRLFCRSGFSDAHSTVGTLAVMLSPPFFSLCFLFMSDIPGTLAVVVCCYAIVRALRCEGRNVVTGWLAFAAVSNLLLGSVRQIALLGVLILVPSAAVWLRRRVRLEILVPVWLVCVTAVAALMHWFEAQPYSVKEPLLPRHDVWHRLDLLWRVPASHMFFLAPLLVLFAARLRWRNRSLQIAAGLSVAALTLLCLRWIHGGSSTLLMPYMISTLNYAGFNDVSAPMGDAPILLTLPWTASLTCLTLLLAAGVLLYLLVPGLRRKGVAAPRTQGLLLVFVPFVLVYLGLFATRVVPFDRYLVALTPLMAMAALAALPRAESTVGLRTWTPALVILLCYFDVASLHDQFALSRARASAAAELTSQGVSRKRIFGGFEYDGWTEVEATGYVKDPKLHLKQGEAGFRRGLTWAPLSNSFFRRGYTPTIVPDYAITYTLVPGVERSEFQDVTFRTWMRPGTWRLIVARIKPGTIVREEQ